MRFSEIIGNSTAIRALRKSIEKEAVAHAYLFSGPDGVGKHSTALAFASALNCEKSDLIQESCGDCLQCKLIETNRHPDVLTISPTGANEETKIDQMREIRRNAQFPPLKGKWKVYIIERAESMNEEAASCILKLLEEPPNFTVLLLISSNYRALLPTIRSRCQMLRFTATSKNELRQALIERFNASISEADFLSSFSEGRPGKAIALLGDPSFFDLRDTIAGLVNKLISEPVYAALKLSESIRTLNSLLKSSNNENYEANEDEQKETAAKGSLSRIEITRALDLLVVWYRDLLSIKLQGVNAPVLNSDKREELIATSQECKVSYLQRSLRTLIDAKRYLNGNANISLTLDVVALRLGF